MKCRVTRYKSVQATSASQLDEKLAAARATIEQESEQAEFVGLELATSQGTIFAVIIWTG